MMEKIIQFKLPIYVVSVNFEEGKWFCTQIETNNLVKK
jgi:hypothetical protein